MSDTALGSLCELFVDRLNDCSSYNHQHHRFFPNDTTRGVFQSNRQDLRRLLQLLLHIPETETTLLSRVVQRTLADLCNVLAILLWVRGRREVLEQFGELLPETNTGATLPRLTDEDLPIDLDTAERFFPLRGRDFYQKQFRFCPVTLKKRGEVIYKDIRHHCPLPYLEEHHIGEGSSGRVYRVKVEKRQLQSSGGQANIQAVEFARKDFELNQAFLDEREVLEKILDQPRRHDNVMVALASLQYGDTYSLFFRLASCNLWEYLSGKEGLDVCEPSDLEGKSDIYRRGVTLAGALAFLHEEFRDKRLESLSCYHLDLKPHNVLVFDLNTPKERWKITDFGLSRVKGRGVDGNTEVDLQVATPFLRKTRKVRAFPEPSTINRRGEGTYLAPECADPRGKVSSASDVWSFGCIFSLVMSFIVGGPASVLQFKNRRREQEANDCFFVTKWGKTQISPVVTGWFNELKDHTQVRGSQAEHDVVCQTVDFLKKRVLHPSRDGRAKASEVEDTLRQISHLFHRRPSDTRIHRRSWRDLFSSRSPLVRQPQKLPVTRSMLSSAFSPRGDFLAFYSQQRIELFVVDRTIIAGRNQEPIPAPFVFPPPRGSWECFAISSNYLCACTNTNYFECYIYPITVLPPTAATFIADGTRIQSLHAGPIKKVAMSPDGMFTAFAITRRASPDNGNYAVSIYYTQDLMDAASDGSHQSPPPSRSNSTTSNSLSETLSIVNNVITTESKIDSIEHIRSFVFSSNGRYLIMVAQPDPATLLIRAWETYSGTSCANLTIPYPGSSTSSDAVFTACSPLNTVPGLILVLQCKYLAYINLWQRNRNLPRLTGHFVNIFVQDDDEALVLLGDEGDRLLRVYVLPISDGDRPKPIEVAKTKIISYKAAKDAAVLTGQSLRGQRELLIAQTDGTFLTIAMKEKDSGL